MNMNENVNPGYCNGCKWHSKNLEGSFYRNEDGSPRDDLCSRPELLHRERTSEAIPVFNEGCKHYTPQEVQE